MLEQKSVMLMNDMLCNSSEPDHFMLEEFVNTLPIEEVGQVLDIRSSFVRYEKNVECLQE